MGTRTTRGTLPPMDRLRRFAWFVLGWNVLTVLGGAAVRATGSGAGCGRSWPTCQGTIVPELRGATAVEFTHRAISGVALALVISLVVRVFRSDSGRRARRAAILSGVAIVGEALIGALIVFSEWVADDASLARTIAVPLHLVNTLFLLAALSLVCFWLGPARVPPERRRVGVLVGGAIGLVAVAATGAVTALADTLFPKDFALGATISGGEHFLTRLRVVHPFASVVVGGVLFWWAWRHARSRPAGRLVLFGVFLQMVLGTANVMAGTPLALSLLHLLVADAIWIGWVWLWAEATAGSATTVDAVNHAAGAVRS